MHKHIFIIKVNVRCTCDFELFNYPVAIEIIRIGIDVILIIIDLAQ